MVGSDMSTEIRHLLISFLNLYVESGTSVSHSISVLYFVGAVKPS